MDEGNLMMKLDFQNAFNSIRRDLMLASALEKVPVVFPLAFTSYCQTSLLFFGKNMIHSSEGIQRDIPLGLSYLKLCQKISVCIQISIPFQS